MGRFLSPFIDAVDAMLFIINLKSISQAGRRGFDPRLPLHFFSIAYSLSSGGTSDFGLKMGRLTEWKGGWGLQSPDSKAVLLAECQPDMLDVVC